MATAVAVITFKVRTRKPRRAVLAPARRSILPCRLHGTWPTSRDRLTLQSQRVGHLFGMSTRPDLFHRAQPHFQRPVIKLVNIVFPAHQDSTRQVDLLMNSLVRVGPSQQCDDPTRLRPVASQDSDQDLRYLRSEDSEILGVYSRISSPPPTSMASPQTIQSTPGNHHNRPHE